jgi:uncharacterized protein involved in outer membrane biogenesis
MKKIVIGILIAAVVLVILVVVGVAVFLNSGVKRGVETVGSRLTQVEVQLESVSLSLLSGSGKLKGLVVGNPTGFKSPSAISIGTASLDLVPRSVFSDKVIVKSINVQSPEITFETDFKSSNLSKILSNLESATGGGTKQPTQPKEANAGKKLEVDDFLITGGKVHVSVTALGGRSVTENLPEIHLQGLGTNPEGITSEELAQKVLQVIVQRAAEAAAGSVAQLSKGALNLTNGVPGSALDNAEKVTKGLGDLFKQKK